MIFSDFSLLQGPINCLEPWLFDKTQFRPGIQTYFKCFIEQLLIFCQLKFDKPSEQLISEPERKKIILRLNRILKRLCK